ncbi:MAG: peptidase, partial [Pseudomonadota bacterium]
PTMFQVARLIGSVLRDVVRSNAVGGQEADTSFSATIILGGQIKGGEQQLFLIYPEGNFLEASSDTPYFQIGETKYGKPILVRAYNPEMSFEDAIKLLLVSFDSTIKANLSVGLPLDVRIYEKNSLEAGKEVRIEAEDTYYKSISSGWGEALKSAFNSLPDFEL